MCLGAQTLPNALGYKRVSGDIATDPHAASCNPGCLRPKPKDRNMSKSGLITALAIASTLVGIGDANAQLAGSSTVGVTYTEATLVAMGWSVKKSILGKSVFNDAGEKIGHVQDLIIAPDKNVSYLIVGAGGFIGIGRHDVAIPVTQVRAQGDRIVVPGATKAIVKAMPQFKYASDEAQRGQFVNSAEEDISKARAGVADLQKRAGAATSELKAQIEPQIAGLQSDLKLVEARLDLMKRATADRWHEFEMDLNAATAKLRKSLAAATS
jgi:sporulation protein YlmC with PRC-barrel domain